MSVKGSGPVVEERRPNTTVGGTAEERDSNG